MSTNLTRAHLYARYLITGRIVLDTALHIGGREAGVVTDSPIIRNGTGHPFIPGSSLKGAFRSAVERIVPNIPGLSSCSLGSGNSECLTALPPSDERINAYLEISKGIGRKPNEAIRRAIELLGDVTLNDQGHVTQEETLLPLLDRYLCDTCKVFGSPYLASVAFFHDASISEVWHNLPEAPTQIRDGVGIDRDSERAREGIKFDFEVVPPQVSFDFSLLLENPAPPDLGLVALGIQEFIAGMIPLGGIRSRGLGRCHLEEVKVEWIDFSDLKVLRQYLLDGIWEKQRVEDFISTYLGALLNQEASNV
jgi:CRISPR-associated RAMP protein (TIGR02581 family)